MALHLLALIAIKIGLDLLGRLLEPGRKRPKPQPFESPTASSGTPCGRGFGIYEAQPTVGYVGSVDIDPEVAKINGGEQDITYYRAKMQLVFGWGPVHVLYDLVASERSVRTQIVGDKQSIDGKDPYISSPVIPFDFRAAGREFQEFSINVRQMFGGNLEGGGLQGILCFYSGTDAQPIDPLFAEVDGIDATAWPWTCYMVLGRESGRPELPLPEGGGDIVNQQGSLFYLSANNPSPPPIGAILGFYPDGLLGGGGKIGLGGNAIEFIYEVSKDRKWGRGWETARIDIEQWRAAARIVRDERLALAVPQDAPRSFDSLIDDIFTHIDGGFVQDPTTGMVQIKLARGNYDPETLLVINRNNTENFQRGSPLAPKSLNDIQVRFRRFIGGIGGATPVEDILTEDSDINSFLPTLGNLFVYKLAGDAIAPESVQIYANDVLLVGVGDINDLGPNQYWIDYEKSNLWIRPGDTVTEHMVFKAVYVSDPPFVGFIDDVATAQNIAHRSMSGRQQPESYDYTYYIDAFSAQWKADRLRATLSKSIDTFSWEGMRDQSHLTPWDVVRITEPEWELDLAVRITHIDYGTVTDPRLTIQAVRDVWGEPVSFSGNIGGGTGPGVPYKPTAPLPVVACGAGGTGVSRIDIFPTSAIFAVEVYEATAAVGTGSTLVATLPAGTTPMFYDGDPLKWYAARQTHPQYNASPLTPWLQCSDTDVITPPECTLPEVSYAADNALGSILLSIYDPQNRITEVRWRYKSGTSDWSEWMVSIAPHDWCVALDPQANSRIEWEYDYVACDGTTPTGTGGYDFIAGPSTKPEDPETPALTSALLIVPIHHNPVEGLVLDVPSEAASIDGEQVGERIPLAGYQSVRLVARIYDLETDLPAAAALYGRFAPLTGAEDPDAPNIWTPFDGVDGPLLSLDPAQFGPGAPLGTLPKTVVSEWVAMVPEAQDEVYVDVGQASGDAVHEALLKRLELQFRTDAIIPDDGDGGGDDDDDPIPDCTAPASVDAFSYANTAAFLAAWTENNSSPANAVFSITGGHVLLSMTGAVGGHAWVTRTLTGTPDEQFTYYLLVNPNVVAVQAFLEHVGGARMIASITGPQTLYVTGTYDSSGNAQLRFGVLDIGQSAAVIVSDDLLDVAGTGWDSEDDFGEGSWVGQDGANGIEGEQHTEEGWFGGHLAKVKTFSGLTPGDSLRLECEMRINAISMGWWDNSIHIVWHPGDVGESGSNATASVSKDNAFHLAVTSYRTVPASGKMTAYLYKDAALADHGVNSTCFFWFRNLAIRSAAGGSATVTFDDLGYCFGIGVGPIDPGDPAVPKDPPVEYPPIEPFVGSRFMGIHDIPESGSGDWNMTIKSFREPSYILSALTKTRANSTYVLPRMGNDDDWGFPFSFARWKAKVDYLKNDANLNAGIAEGRFPIHYIMDEPNRLDRYGSGGVQIGIVEDMCEYSKSIWPNWPTVVRVSPIISWFTRKINGLDFCWGEYLLARGPIVDFMHDCEDAIARLGIGIIYGLHYGGFDTAHTNRLITAAEIDYYGTNHLAQQSYARGLAGWKYFAGLNTADRLAAVHRMMLAQAANDPT
jgi:hypothetical protein